MNVALIEDEPLALARLEELLGEVRPDAVVTARLRSMRDVRVWLGGPAARCDVVLADVELGDGRSMDALSRADVGVPVIYTTAYDRYVLESLSANGVAYLMKPVSAGDLAQALTRLARMVGHVTAAERRAPASDRLVGRRGLDWVGVTCASVRWVRVQDGLTHAVTADGKRVMLDHPLREIEAMLAPRGFFRVNRWVLCAHAGIAGVRSAGKGRLLLLLDPPSDEEVIVPQEGAAAFRAWFGM